MLLSKLRPYLIIYSSNVLHNSEERNSRVFCFQLSWHIFLLSFNLQRFPSLCLYLWHYHFLKSTGHLFWSLFFSLGLLRGISGVFFPPLMIRFKSHTFVRNTTGSVIFPLLLFVLLRGTAWQFGQVPRGGIGWVFLHRRVCNCIYREDIQRLKNTTFHPPLVSAFHWVVQWWFSKFIIPSLVLDFCHKS